MGRIEWHHKQFAPYLGTDAGTLRARGASDEGPAGG